METPEPEEIILVRDANENKKIKRVKSLQEGENSIETIINEKKTTEKENS